MATFGPEAFSYLSQWLTTGSANQRIMAADTVGLIGPQAVTLMPETLALLDQPDAALRSAAARAIGQIGENAKEAGPALASALSDPEWSVRYHAAKALGATQSNHHGVRDALINGSRHDRDARVRDACVEALGGRRAEENRKHSGQRS
jgi:hypothetical protein